MPASVPFFRDLSALGFQIVRKGLGHRHRTNRVALPGRDQNPTRLRRRRRFRLEGNERMHEGGRIEEIGKFDQDIGKDIRAIGKAEPDNLACLMRIAVRRNEIGHAAGRPVEVVKIIDAFGLAAEERAAPCSETSPRGEITLALGKSREAKSKNWFSSPPVP